MRHRLKLPQALRWRRRHGVGRSRELGRSSQITVSGRGNTHGRSSFAASARTKSLRGIRKKDFVFLLFGFDKAICSKEFDNGVHFYLEDSKFERMWRNPYRYIPILKRFSFVLTPDFSIYTDMPEAMQIWNIFSSRLLGQMLQREGITVIPSVSWGDHESFSFCFDGLPRNSILSVSSVGVFRNREARQLFLEGLNVMCATLIPSTVIFYGKNPGFNFKEIVVHNYEDSNYHWKKQKSNVY